MSAFKLHTLKQKLWAIVAVSFAARVIMFSTLPNMPTSLAPDEAAYANLTKWIGESKPALQFPDYGEGLYLSARSLILPASIFFRLGLDELDATRLTSSVYGFASLVLLVLITLKLYSGYISKSFHSKNNERLIVVILCFFAFLPSHFLWSNLALRESATEFWSLFSLITFFVVYHLHKKLTALGIAILICCVILTFSARPQVGWVVGVSLVVYLVMNFRKTASRVLTLAIISATLLGATMNTNLSSYSFGKSVGPLINVGETISYKHEMNQAFASSIIQTQSCPLENSSITFSPPVKVSTYLCIIWRAPYMASTFLFRPIVGVDVTSGSSYIAAVENLIWVTFFIIIIVMFYKKRSIPFLKPLLPSMIFFVFYALGASAYQGNMGTAFRHKSIILWVILLLIVVLMWRTPQSSLKSSMNNSQGNAV